jgi:hypothetical protein
MKLMPLASFLGVALATAANAADPDRLSLQACARELYTSDRPSTGR